MEAPTAFPSFSPSTVLEFRLSSSGHIALLTLTVFGGYFLVCLVFYSCVRQRYPKAFNIRSWAPKVKTELADRLYGSFDWVWELFWISDEDMRQECGLDAVCLCRVLMMGFKISILGCVNACYLVPIYYTAPLSEETRVFSDDPYEKMTVANVPDKSDLFYASVAAQYIIILYTMRLMRTELKWFTEQRHQWLMEEKPRNYTVYCTGIPKESRTSAKLLEYFRDCFHYGDVLEARVALIIPNLQYLVAKRERLIGKLEHAINQEELTGSAPVVHGDLLSARLPRDAISVYAQQLDELNQEITRRKATLLADNDPNEVPDTEDDEYSLVSRKPPAVNRRRDDTGSSVADSSAMSSLSEADTSERVTPSELLRSAETRATNPVTNTAGAMVEATAPGVPGPTVVARQLANVALNTFGLIEDGSRLESGFVTFTKLSTRQAALQMVHNPEPFVMDVFEAPDPDDIFWPNCGRPNDDLQFGMLMSIMFTLGLLLIWTFPTSFIVSLTNVQTLANEFNFLADAIRKSPILGDLLSVIAPLILIPLNDVLKVFLRWITKYEGPVSGAVLESSLFIKQAVFKIIQTFFVSSIAGVASQDISELLDEGTGSIVDVLTVTLPNQALYFLQIVMTFTSIQLSFELLRIWPLLSAFVRKFMPPKLSEKERNKTILFGFLRPLSDPPLFEHADVLSQSVLYFLILLCYGVAMPIMYALLVLVFLLLSAGYRNQFIYVYPVTDAGGRMFKTFMLILPMSMLISEVLIAGYLAVKRAIIPACLMIPLIAITILFYQFIGQRHFKVANSLPSRECVKMDKKRSREGRANLEFLKSQYLQPALRAEDEARAENMGVTQEIRHTGVRYITPPGSEAELESIPEEDEEQESTSDVISGEETQSRHFFGFLPGLRPFRGRPNQGEDNEQEEQEQEQGNTGDAVDDGENQPRR